MRSAKFFSAYHFDSQSLMIPSRNPIGWIFCPTARLPLLALHHDGDVAGPLLDHVRPAPRPRLHPPCAGAAVDIRPEDPQRVPREVEVVLGVGGGRFHDLRHRPGGPVRREPEDGEGLVDALPLDERHHGPDLPRRDVHVPRDGLHLHGRSSLTTAPLRRAWPRREVPPPRLRRGRRWVSPTWSSPPAPRGS